MSLAIIPGSPAPPPAPISDQWGLWLPWQRQVTASALSYPLRGERATPCDPLRGQSGRMCLAPVIVRHNNTNSKKRGGKEKKTTPPAHPPPGLKMATWADRGQRCRNARPQASFAPRYPPAGAPERRIMWRCLYHSAPVMGGEGSTAPQRCS